MRRSNGVKVISLLLGMLLCLAIMQGAFAKQEKSDKDEIENVTNSEPENCTYTKHTIDPSYYSVYLMAGNSKTFTVSFTNEGSKALNITPKLVDIPYSNVGLNENWITITPACVKVNPDIKQDFEVKVDIPEDEKTGYYQTSIVFTDDIDPSVESSFNQYINAMNLDVNVRALPKLELQSSSISDTLEAGKEYEYVIKMKNVADEDITIDPEITENDYYDLYRDSENSDLSSDIIEISAPSTIKAGEVANMTIRVPVPENATGTYDGYIEMNVNGEINDGSVPQVNLYFTVAKNPSVPYVKTFSTTTTEPITIEVSTDTYNSDMGLRVSPKREKPSFELSLKCNSSPVNLTLAKIMNSGTVYTGGYSYPEWAMDDSTIYQNNGNHYVETYTIPGAVGDWELTILPKNAEYFGYSITFGDSQ